MESAASENRVKLWVFAGITHVKRGQLSVAHAVQLSDQLDGFFAEHRGTSKTSTPNRTEQNTGNLSVGPRRAPTVPGGSRSR